MTEQVKEIFRGIGSAITGALFFALGIGLISLMLGLFAHRAKAQEPFIGFGIDMEHHKHESNLCYSGGMSRNLTFSGKIMAGIESNDIRTYVFYKNSRCVLNGDLQDSDDHWRADQVINRDESVGVSFEWRTNF